LAAQDAPEILIGDFALSRLSEGTLMDFRIKETSKTVEDVPGWLTRSEGKLLFNLAKSCAGRGVIVEIGSWKGKSTIWLAKGSQAGQNVKVYAIDPHSATEEHRRQGNLSTFQEFQQNISRAGVAGLVFPIVTTSEAAAASFNTPIEMIFIDGDHDYEAVKRDFELWYPKVVDGGVMAFHDTTVWQGPKKLVAERMYKSRHFCDGSFAGSIAFATKVRANTGGQRLRNRLALCAKNCVGPLQDFVENQIENSLLKARQRRKPEIPSPLA
jgi:MMP 1-O-methyltransferase